MRARKASREITCSKQPGSEGHEASKKISILSISSFIFLILSVMADNSQYQVNSQQLPPNADIIVDPFELLMEAQKKTTPADHNNFT